MSIEPEERNKLIFDYLSSVQIKKNAAYILKFVFEWKTEKVTKYLNISEGGMWRNVAEVNNDLIHLFGNIWDKEVR